MEIKPQYARFKITEGCNLKCKSCSHWKKQQPEQPSLAEIEQLAADLEQEGFTHIGLTGGEPGLRQDLEEIIDIFNERGLAVGMTSNGTLIDADRLNTLIDKGLDSINISIHGPKQVHNSIVRKEAYDKAMECAKAASSLAEENEFHVTSGAVLSDLTAPRLIESIEDKAKIGVPTTIQPLMASSYFFEGDDQWLEEENIDQVVDRLIEYKKKHPEMITNPLYSLKWLKRYFRNPRVPEVPCTFGYLAIGIDAELNFYSCWSLPSLGNLKQDNLGDLLRSEEFKQRQQDMFNKKCQGCSCGYIIRLGTINLEHAWQLFRSKSYRNQF